MAKTLRIEVSSDHNPAATPIDGKYIVAFIRKQLLPGEVYPVNTRYNPDCDCTEYSPDGGATWEPNPAGDPRITSPLPPQTGSNAACNSAASERKYLVRWSELLQTVGSPATTATGLAYGILGLLLDLSGPWAILFEVIVAAALGLIDAGLTAINLAFSDENLDLVECILYCHLNAQFQLDASSFAAVQADITALIGGTEATILNLVLSVQGFGGINSAMALKLDTDDCSSCDACNWCYTVDLTAGVISPFTVIWGGFVPGQGIRVDEDHAVSQQNTKAIVAWTTPAGGGPITSIDFGWTITAVGTSPVSVLGNYPYTTNLSVVSLATGTSHRTITAPASNPGYEVQLVPSQTGSYAGRGYLRYITLRGTGNNPFGSDNCT